MLVLDHLAIGCTELAQGVAWVENALGVAMQPGGRHERYGTHNMLLGLGEGLYLEVIAKDPDAAPFEGPSWFGLEAFDGPPRLTNWICRTDDIGAAVAAAPAAVGASRQLSRGDLHWQITVPEDGSLPYQGGFPTLLEWAAGTVHPASRLPDSRCRLTSFEVSHPDADELRNLVALDDKRIRFVTGDAGFRATFDTPSGSKVLT